MYQNQGADAKQLNMETIMWKGILTLCTACICAMPLNAAGEIKVLAIAGSTREDSLNKKLVTDAAEIARETGASVTIVDLKDFPMPLYDADLEAKEGMPETAKQLRKLMMQSQVILIASPEYNSSLSAVLKNAIDWASRNEKGQGSRDAFKGKKFAIMSVSPGPTGGARGLVHLRTIIEAIGGTVLSDQIAVPNGANAFDDKGLLKNQQQQKDLQQLVKRALD